MNRRRTAAVLLPLLVAAGCATGDGTTLTPPAPGQTAPPTTTSDSVVDDETPGGDLGTATLPSVPLDSEEPFAPLEGQSTVTVPADADPSTFAAFAPWEDGGPIGVTYTCDGEDLSPPIAWIGLPPLTEEVAITLVDETTIQRGRAFVHWVLAGIATSAMGLSEGSAPEGSYAGINYYGVAGYDGPCPEPGSRHDYLLTIHALGQPLGLEAGTPADEMVDAIDELTIETAVVVGSVER